MSDTTDQATASSEYRRAINAHVYGVRGSLLTSSIEGLRQYGYFDAYARQLDPAWRENVLFCLASAWVPVDVAMAHYGACERLELSKHELEQLGELAADRITRTCVPALLASSRPLGVASSPWTPLGQYPRVWERLMQGGSFAVHKLSEKEAVIENSGIPLLHYRNFRSATICLLRASIGKFAPRCLARELPWPGDDERIRVSVRWA